MRHFGPGPIKRKYSRLDLRYYLELCLFSSFFSFFFFIKAHTYLRTRRRPHYIPDSISLSLIFFGTYSMFKHGQVSLIITRFFSLFFCQIEKKKSRKNMLSAIWKREREKLKRKNNPKGIWTFSSYLNRSRRKSSLYLNLHKKRSHLL